MALFIGISVQQLVIQQPILLLFLGYIWSTIIFILSWTCQSWSVALTNSNRIDIIVSIKPQEKTTSLCLDNLIQLPELTPCSKEASVETTTEEIFKCVRSGTFANPDNPNEFYICHKQAEYDFEKIKLSCPRGMTFDKRIKKCSHRRFEEN